MLRRIFAALLAAAALLSLSACGGKSVREKDAALLVQGNLDQIYRGQISPEYGELSGVTPEAAAEDYDAAMAAEAAYFCDYFCVENPTPATMERLTSLLQRACAQSTYTLGQVTREKDGSCSVPVEVHPGSALVRTAKALPDSLADFYAKYPPDADGDAAHYENDWAQAVLTVLSAQLDADAPVGEAVSATIHVVQSEDGTWTVSGDDLQIVDSAMLLYP